MEHMRRNAPHVPTILDAKRGDIGSTAEQYAIEAFERYGADAVTLSPFMGFDSVEPYLRHAGQGRLPAVPHQQPRRRRPAGPAPGRRRRRALPLRARCAAGPGAVEPERPARPGGRRHLPGRDRARARAGADGAAADPRRRRAGRRRGRHGARRLARGRADRRQLVARHLLRVVRRRLRRSRAARGAAHARRARSRQAPERHSAAARSGSVVSM